MFKNRKLFKDFISGVKQYRYTTKETSNILKTLPINVIRRIGKAIIYTDFDGYNENKKYCQLAYFDNLNRRGKELFIEERLYKLCV